ncbi:unnamed protein product [Mucor hiemalis]
MQDFMLYPTRDHDHKHTQQCDSAIEQHEMFPALTETVPLSPFTASPDDSDLHFSYEDLSTAFSQANLDATEEELYDDTEDYETEPPSAAGATLLDMLKHFPDLPSFLDSEHFPTFANIWFEFRKITALAKHPENRLSVQRWLESTALQIHYTMITIVKSNSESTDPESQPRRMFSAFRRLKDRIEITHQVFSIIENGRVYLNQSPSEAIAPLLESAIKIRKDVDFLLNSPSSVIPVIEQNDVITLKDASQVTMTELSNSVMNTYNLMPYTYNSSTTVVENVQHQQTSSHLDNNCLSMKNELSTNQSKPPIFSHIQPSLIHFASSSLPVTPHIDNTNNLFTQFLSLPTSPTCAQEGILVDNTCAPCNSVHDLSLSPYQTNSPLNTLSHDGDSEYEIDPMDVEIQNTKIRQETDDEDDDYVASDNLEDEDWKEKPVVTRRRSRRNTFVTTTSVVARKGEQNVVTVKELRKPSGSERHYTRRTATSYDAQTTHYLKSVFFDIYSTRDKLTKEQRRQVEKDTGLKPRNITYWFSNHKRRFQNSLLVFKKVVKDSNGIVKTYDDFLEWRRLRGLPEEVLDAEVAALTATDNKLNDTIRLA